MTTFWVGLLLGMCHITAMLMLCLDWLDKRMNGRKR